MTEAKHLLNMEAAGLDPCQVIINPNEDNANVHRFACGDVNKLHEMRSGGGSSMSRISWQRFGVDYRTSCVLTDDGREFREIENNPDNGIAYGTRIESSGNNSRVRSVEIGVRRGKQLSREMIEELLLVTEPSINREITRFNWVDVSVDGRRVVLEGHYRANDISFDGSARFKLGDRDDYPVSSGGLSWGFPFRIIGGYVISTLPDERVLVSCENTGRILGLSGATIDLVTKSGLFGSVDARKVVEGDIYGARVLHKNTLSVFNS